MAKTVAVSNLYFLYKLTHFVKRDAQSQRVYIQKESLPRFLSCGMRLKYRSEFVLIIFYLQLINSGHADSSMTDKKHGKHDKLSS